MAGFKFSNETLKLFSDMRIGKKKSGSHKENISKALKNTGRTKNVENTRSMRGCLSQRLH